MKFLFRVTTEIDGREVSFNVYLHTNGSYYAESMDSRFDNFLLDKVNDRWTTRLTRNNPAAEQIGEAIEKYIG